MATRKLTTNTLVKYICIMNKVEKLFSLLLMDPYPYTHSPPSYSVLMAIHTPLYWSGFRS